MFCQACGSNVADGTAFCTACGRPIVGYSVGQPGGGAAAVALPSALAVAQTSTAYAGFWLRLVATILDSIILAVPSAPLFFLLFASALPTIFATRNGGASPALLMVQLFSRFIVFFIIVFIGEWLYWALMESSGWQATLGKKALGLYVTDLEGNRVSFGKASGRFWSGRGIAIVPTVGGLYFLIDCICCGFTEKKQAVHDMISGCLVMRKP